MVVVFSAPARTDLLDILTYIAQDNVTAALVVVDEIE
jgi:plasmid stabilization system protein ParE